MILVPSVGSLRYLPDLMEVEALARLAGGERDVRLRFSDASGRERAGSSWRDLRVASGVVVVETPSARIVTSEALFAFAEARCPCGDDALVDIHELYKRTHGGTGPARLLRACQLGRGLRGRCRACKKPLDRASVRAPLEAPFAHVAVSVAEADGLPRALERATGFPWRAAP